MYQRSQAERSHQYKWLQTSWLCGRCGFWHGNGLHDCYYSAGAWVHLRIFGKREGVCYSFLRYLPGGKRYYSGGRKGKKSRGKGEVPLRKQPRSAVSSGAVFKRMYVWKSIGGRLRPVFIIGRERRRCWGNEPALRKETLIENYHIFCWKGRGITENEINLPLQ